MAFLDETGLSTVVSNIKNKFLAKSGGEMTGQITKDTGGSWIGARDRSIVRTWYASSNGYSPLFTVKTTSGAWTMGGYSTIGEDLIFSYTTDSNYSSGNNTTTICTIKTDGTFTGNANNVVGVVSVAHGGTGASNWLSARESLGTYASTSAPSTQNSGWAGTIWVQY